MRFFNSTFRAYSFWLCAGAAFLCLAGCKKEVQPLTALETVKQQGVLHVVTRNSPAAYFEDNNGETGFEYELSRRFAKKIGVKLQIETVDSLDTLYDKVKTSDKPIVGAAGLTKTDQRDQQVLFSNAYLEAQSQVIYRKGAKRPGSAKGLVGKSILVIKGSSQANRLEKLKEQYPTLTYQESDAVDITDLLQMIEDEKIDITLINSNELAIMQVYYPNVRVAFNLKGEQKLAWITTKTEDSSLADAINEFFDASIGDGSLKRLTDRFYGHIEVLGYVGAYTFAQHLQERLPLYEKFFIRYGNEYKVDWKLLAAVGYQESHWNPAATSRTGVKGLMMLTQITAKAMGVTDRVDPEQSIQGGAKLLSILKQGVDKEVVESDKIYFALAAYNMGAGHVRDAQKLANMQGLNDKEWRNVNQVLLLLSQKQWHQQTRYGYARGFETKQFVKNVRRYYDILNWLEHSQREIPTINNEKLHIPAVSHNEFTQAASSTLL